MKFTIVDVALGIPGSKFFLVSWVEPSTEHFATYITYSNVDNSVQST